MAPALKQRLVGAIVLVALAVIFVPMLLDGSGRQGGEKVSVEIPEEPQDPDPAFEQDDPAGSDAPSAGESSTASATDATDDAEATATDEPATDNAEPASEPDSPSSEPTASASASASDDGATNQTTDSSVNGEEKTSSDGASPTAWVVQVGSFGQKTNAVVLRDKLRDADRDAFIEQGETDSGSVWRVRVGPVTTREEAEALKKRLDSERETESLVMSYPD